MHGILQKNKSTAFQEISVYFDNSCCLPGICISPGWWHKVQGKEACALITSKSVLGFDLPSWVETGVRAWCVTELSCKCSVEIKDEGRDIRQGRKGGGFTQKDELAVHTMWSAHLKLFRLLINDWINLINMNNPMQVIEIFAPFNVC